MIIRRALYLLPAWLLLSCDESVTKTVDSGQFTMEIPKNWKYEGRSTFGLMSAAVVMTDGQEAQLTMNTPDNYLNVDQGTHQIVFEMIDGKRAKLIIPKSLQEGTTGVYFDSLSVNRTWAFLMSGRDLTPRNHELLLQTMRSLKFTN
jgi:hypothetical protein